MVDKKKETTPPKNDEPLVFFEKAVTADLPTGDRPSTPQPKKKSN